MADDTVKKSWKLLHDSIRAALEKSGTERDLQDFETWFSSEPKTSPAPTILHASVGMDGLRIGHDGDESVIDRLIRAMTRVSQ